MVTPSDQGSGRDAIPSSASDPLVSVVSLAYNRRANVLELLEALRWQDYRNVEIVLVDNNSQDGTVGAVESAHPEVRLFRCPQNFGMVSYNFGFANARGQYILVIDDDGLPASSDWISRVVACFEADPCLGAVACTIRMRDTGRVAYDNPQYSSVGDELAGFEAAAYNGTGAGLRAEGLHKVGYYPFAFFRSFLELHLCTRLIDAGWEVRYFPKLEVWHSRPSGSTNRPVTYYGLRSYFWYLWTLYPWPEVTTESIRYLGYCLKLLLRRHLAVTVLARALRDACLGWPRLSADRRPVSSSTVTHLERVRAYTNRSALVPEHRLYVGPNRRAQCC
jgi:GT2 family glycosyltransferase